MRKALIAIVLAACGGGAAKRPAPDFKQPELPADKSSCERMADHLVELLRKLQQQGSEADHRDLEDKIARVLIKSCTEGGWSAEARTCFLEATTLDATNRCEPMLTAEQKAATDKAMEQAMGSPPPPRPPAQGE